MRKQKHFISQIVKLFLLITHRFQIQTLFFPLCKEGKSNWWNCFWESLDVCIKRKWVCSKDSYCADKKKIPAQKRKLSYKCIKYTLYFSTFIRPESLDLDAQTSLWGLLPFKCVCAYSVSVHSLTGSRPLPGCISVCTLSSNLQRVRDRELELPLRKDC